MNDFPISLDTFKTYFSREAGLEFQPYNTWVKTVWDTGEYCLYNDTVYHALQDKVHSIPEDGEDWISDTIVYEQGNVYAPGCYVYYDGKFYTSTEVTSSVPDTLIGWEYTDMEETFPGCRPWKEPIAYGEEENVIAMVNFKPGVWTSQIADNYDTPGKSENWEFSEEGTEEMDGWILDSDILRAMGEASFKFNPRLYPKNRQEIIFLYLTMFFLVYDRQAAASGLNGNSAAGPVIHRTVGKMSVTYMESTLYKSNPSYEFLSSNEYGKKAYNLMAPYLRGGVRFFAGANTGD